MTYRIVKTATFLLLLFALTGCIKVDYIGQTFPELPDGTMVAFFGADKPVPAGTYRMIGQVRLTANDGTTEADFRAKLESVALDCGADAVKIIHYERTLVDAEQVTTVGNDTYEPSSSSTSTGPMYIDSFGDPLPRSKVAMKRYKVVVDAVVLVQLRRFEAVMAERRAERDGIPADAVPAPDQIAAPAPVPTPEATPAETVPASETITTEVTPVSEELTVTDASALPEPPAATAPEAE